jgi:hypothetical protein
VLVIREQAGAVEPPGVLKARLAVVRQELGVLAGERPRPRVEQPPTRPTRASRRDPSAR